MQEILEKLQRGEDVSPQDILEIEAAEKLAALKAEAQRRAEVCNLEDARRLRRERLLDEMLSLDRQAERARRDVESGVREKEIVLQQLTEKITRAEGSWFEAHRNFVVKFGELEPNVNLNSLNPDERIDALKTELQRRGAKLVAVCYNNQGFGGRSALSSPTLPPLDDDGDDGFPDGSPPAVAKAA